MNKSNSDSGLTAKRSNRRLTAVLTAIAIIALCAISCNPEAKWETEDVNITMNIKKVSAGFVECDFSTDKGAYYLVAIENARIGYDPMAHQKQFMMLAIDSANVEYLAWRNYLLKNGEFNIAPFSSHSLQYGSINYFFTGLQPNQDYWIYAFVVDPETLQPKGKLHLEHVTTKETSDMDIHFDYRIKGYWDYIYPVDSVRKIYNNFPYIATTYDSLRLVDLGVTTDIGAVVYFAFWSQERFTYPDLANVIYGVHAIENDGRQSAEMFEEGHTYYTGISGYDGSYKQTTVYKFKWTGTKCNYYFHDTDSANIAYWLKDLLGY